MKKVFITGSTKGIGKEIALAFLRKEDYLVIVHGRSYDSPDFVKNNRNCSYFPFDLADFKNINKIIEFLNKEKIDIFISNAGLYSSDDLSEVLLVNYVSPSLIINTILPLLEEKEGILVNINSLAGIFPNFKESIYCSTKFGMDGYFKSLQSNFSSKIKITQYYLGATKTNMTRGRENYDNLIDPAEFAESLVADLSAESFIIHSKIIKRKK